MAACQACVFQTPEVLEHVFLQLDLRSVLTSAQRVNRFWHSIIHNSPAIQKALFYRIDDTGKGDNGETGSVSCNPLLSELCPALFNLRSDAREFPIKQDIFIKTSSAKQPSPDVAPVATWRRMLVQQHPPVRTIGMWWLVGNWEGTLWATAKLFSVESESIDASSTFQPREREDGLRMGDYLDLAAYKSKTKPDRVLAFWPANDRPRDHSSFLAEVEEPKHCDHPVLEEMLVQKQRIAREADMILATPLDIYLNLPGKTSVNGAPYRDNAMTRFLDIEQGGSVAGDACRFKETYSWSAKLKNGFNADWWAQEQDDWEGCAWFD